MEIDPELTLGLELEISLKLTEEEEAPSKDKILDKEELWEEELSEEYVEMKLDKENDDKPEEHADNADKSDADTDTEADADTNIVTDPNDDTEIDTEDPVGVNEASKEEEADIDNDDERPSYELEEEIEEAKEEQYILEKEAGEELEDAKELEDTKELETTDELEIAEELETEEELESTDELETEEELEIEEELETTDELETEEELETTDELEEDDDVVGLKTIIVPAVGLDDAQKVEREVVEPVYSVVVTYNGRAVASASLIVMKFNCSTVVLDSTSPHWMSIWIRFCRFMLAVLWYCHAVIKTRAPAGIPVAYTSTEESSQE